MHLNPFQAILDHVFFVGTLDPSVELSTLFFTGSLSLPAQYSSTLPTFSYNYSWLQVSSEFFCLPLYFWGDHSYYLR